LQRLPFFVTYRARCDGRRRRYRYVKELRIPEGELSEWGPRLNRESRPRRKGPTWDVTVLLEAGFYTVSSLLEFTDGVRVVVHGVEIHAEHWWALAPPDFDEGTILLFKDGGHIAVRRHSRLRLDNLVVCHGIGVPPQRPVGAWLRACEAARTLEVREEAST